jgi:hypothetical protein
MQFTSHPPPVRTNMAVRDEETRDRNRDAGRRSDRRSRDSREGDPVAGEEAVTSAIDLSDEAIAKLESAHPSGLSSQAILDTLDGTKFKISEATLRKWVQLGLLPRSLLVGRKG